MFLTGSTMFLTWLPTSFETEAATGGALYKKVFFKNVVNFAGNLGNIFRPATLLKRDSNTGVFL